MQVGTGDSNVLRVVYDLPANRWYLLNDAGDSYSKGYEPGTGVVLQNSQGQFAVKATPARLLDETTLQINWTIAALSPLVGSPRSVSLFVVVRGGLKSGFHVGATWTITP